MPTKKPNKTEEIIGKIFKDSDLVYGLKEFEDIKINDVLEIIEDEPNRFYLTDLKSGKKRFVYDEKKNSGRPEEIVRQLWFHKLITHYKYPIERIEVEKSVHFGREVHAKAADLVVYKKDKITPYIIVEVKAPNEKKGEDQLKTYLSAEGAEIGVWANGTDKIILYRPYPREYEALTEIPRADQTIDDLFEVKRKWSNLSPKFDFTKIIRRIEELALAGSGANVFEETFKLIYAKLYDEKLAREKRVDEEVLFKGYKDPQRTYDVINSLFKEAIKEWPDTFELSDKIKLTPSRLNICVPLMAGIRLFELGQGEYELVDQAFEHLITEVSKGRKGQYFTPRHAIKMCVQMLNPKEKEYIIDPACGSGGFMLHTMYHVWDNYLKTDAARKDYAGKYLYGIDFDDNMRRISQALMLIAGDGKHHIFKRDSLDSREWTGEEAEDARVSLKPLLHHFENTESDKENKLTYRHLDFDLVLTNPPFAGENPESGLLRQYELARKEGGKLKNNVERHILFIERALDMLRPGGRMAIVLPQGVLNNTNMEYVREYLFDKARILAVVGLHGNTFKPHTGTKTSVLFLQKWKDKPLKDYPIFMAVSKKGGKDNSGDYIYKKDANGNYFHDTKGRKVLDHDLDEIADGFLKFAKEEKFNF
ncbi:MAG: Type I Restriction Enzyme [Candidatus Nomurabacteria bacterium GW2011_GWA1_37_20]|uniref:Type I Restriction Enzyme n=2 Tax=Parcubacteria group TaxID=1794811 RepID=A0A0G0HWM2_9BACT|nr:MAG: Type I Restriction Enzyme [Candidatus Nomurabacteria bacterium GW2011_GWA1_37_20]KKQ47558.1 MAG: Type I Restriction Enzyme [Candidatus Yanofskybacteria bacterium GW2011_GWC2_37_9]